MLFLGSNLRWHASGEVGVRECGLMSVADGEAIVAAAMMNLFGRNGWNRPGLHRLDNTKPLGLSHRLLPQLPPLLKLLLPQGQPLDPWTFH